MANDLLETNYDDDVAITFGTTTKFKVLYKSASTRLDIQDDAGNTLVYIEDQGTTGKLTITGDLTVDDDATVTGDLTAGTISLTTGALSSGSFTPTVGTTANVASSASPVAFYMRIGAYVYYEFSVSITPTAGTTYTTFEVDLPVASNLSGAADAKGNGSWVISTTTLGACWAQGVAANDSVEVRFISNNTSAHVVHCTVMYKVI